MLNESEITGLSIDHEVLTRHGWIRVSNLHKGSRILSVDHLTGVRGFTPITRVETRAEYGNFIQLEGDTISQQLSSNHRIDTLINGVRKEVEVKPTNNISLYQPSTEERTPTPLMELALHLQLNRREVVKCINFTRIPYNTFNGRYIRGLLDATNFEYREAGDHQILITSRKQPSSAINHTDCKASSTMARFLRTVLVSSHLADLSTHNYDLISQCCALTSTSLEKRAIVGEMPVVRISDPNEHTNNVTVSLSPVVSTLIIHIEANTDYVVVRRNGVVSQYLLPEPICDMS